MTYIVHLLILIGIYSLLSLSLNLTAGFLGLVSICQAAFFGVGAYSAGILLTEYNADGIAVLLASFVLGWTGGTVLGMPLCRLRGDHFAVATFAFQASASAVFYNLRALTGGASGLAAIRPLRLCGMQISSEWKMLLVIAVTCFLFALLQQSLRCSPAARVLATLRENEVGVVVLGLNPSRYKRALFASGAGVAALSGALYASYMTFIDPSLFGIGESILILCCLILGGPGNVMGPIVGATILVLLPETLRFLGLPAAVAANLRQIVFGGALIVLMIVRPCGLFGTTAVDAGAGVDDRSPQH